MGEKSSITKKESTGELFFYFRKLLLIWFCGTYLGLRVKSWGPVSLNPPIKPDIVNNSNYFKTEKKFPVIRSVSSSKTFQSKIGSGLKATSLLNIFMHSQPEAMNSNIPGPSSSLTTSNIATSGDQTFKKGQMRSSYSVAML